VIQCSVGSLFLDILGTRLADPLGLVVEDDAERRVDEKDSERLTVRRTDDTVDVMKTQYRQEDDDILDEQTSLWTHTIHDSKPWSAREDEPDGRDGRCEPKVLHY
jgi:hypothetical protein